MVEEWTEELTREYQRELAVREGGGPRPGAPSLDAVFERAQAIKGPLPVAFVFAIYVGACAHLAGEGRRPVERRQEGGGGRVRRDLDPGRIHVGFEGQITIDWSSPDTEEPKVDSRRRRSYRSPEERRGLPVDDRADLFALTLSVAELFVLKRLSNGEPAIGDSEGWDDFAELVRSGARLPRDLGLLMRSALAENSDERPSGARRVLEELTRIGRRNGLSAHRAAIASHMHRLFVEPSPLPPSAAQPAVQPSDAHGRGSLDVFASLFPKSGPTKVPQLLPPPPVDQQPFVSSGGVAPRPARLPSFATPSATGVHRSTSRARDSETPTALARSIPPPLPMPISSDPKRALAKLRIALGSRVIRAAVVAAVFALTILVSLRSRPGKIVTVATGHGGEPLANAEMHLDAEQHCTSTRCTFETTAGVHEVTAKADGYLPQLQLVAVGPGEAAAINFRLDRGGSSLDVSGRPEGASLVVDGKWIGRMPLHVDLAPGLHRVRIEADRFAPDERLVELRLGETKKIGDIALLPHMGWVTIDARTPDAQVTLVSGTERIEHLETGQPVELDLSRHWTLVATKDGYQTVREPLVWNDSLDKTFVLTLEKTAPAARR